ncbi:MAG: hypothetical protein IKP47_07075 [Ruminococcus sp.]|nr:hypothetical protein [Ruminococcus sp.]
MKKLFDNRKLCRKCGKELRDDAYCRYCGAKRSVKLFNPVNMRVECVYGPPPVPRVHHCDKCGYEWTTCMMIDREEYCPKCGGSAPGRETLKEKEE